MPRTRRRCVLRDGCDASARRRTTSTGSDSTGSGSPRRGSPRHNMDSALYPFYVSLALFLPRSTPLPDERFTSFRPIGGPNAWRRRRSGALQLPHKAGAGRGTRRSTAARRCDRPCPNQTAGQQERYHAHEQHGGETRRRRHGTARVVAMSHRRCRMIAIDRLDQQAMAGVGSHT
jgi:hypothetical protein